MRTFCRTLLCNYMKDNKIRISEDCYDSYQFLQKKKINPAKYLRDGGEKLVIKTADKNKFKLKKVIIPF